MCFAGVDGGMGGGGTYGEDRGVCTVLPVVWPTLYTQVASCGRVRLVVARVANRGQGCLNNNPLGAAPRRVPRGTQVAITSGGGDGWHVERLGRYEEVNGRG